MHYFHIDCPFFYDRALLCLPINCLECHHDGEGLAFGESQPGRSCFKAPCLTNLCVNEDDMNASPSPLSPQGHMDEDVQAALLQIIQMRQGLVC